MPAPDNAWRTTALLALSQLHSSGSLADATFEIIASTYSVRVASQETREVPLKWENWQDLAFILEGPFRWRWETYQLGPKSSADILSKHLIMPLISVTHLAFASADPVSELSEADLQGAIDKTARTARRTGIDTHVKHAMSKPGMASAISRITALMNGSQSPPNITLDPELPQINVPSMPHVPKSVPKQREASPDVEMIGEPVPDSSRHTPEVQHRDIRKDSPPAAVQSETESEDEESPVRPVDPMEDVRDGPTPAIQPADVHREESGPNTQHSDADSDSVRPPSRPHKKPRSVTSSSDEEDAGGTRRGGTAQRASATGVRRGARQPLRRGAKRF
ncbi:hypothetical protein PUNSTDRAFT_128654 [Punctularia strigosozonata HHB-11173 SS5]|uniref:Uncharacterized protein n=1 Tax=Punctularia strigosozonata (strain HHB-11173) TaxID=741275 RepID=R7S0K9_PUNST|nr:uncharacterized protein PUNSTDRAFT_128654 [Punctularia strigosozonata HHB-11173 SS5]EIN03738.1 hypothetical protein PUNSTDRAFT_128654 [Punctularia strigosozonata HHB-11173 SS5]